MLQYLLKPCQKTTIYSWDVGHFCLLCSHWYLSSPSSPDVFDFTDDLTAHKQRIRETTMWRKLYSQTWCNPMPVKLKTSHYHLSGRPTKNLRMKRQRRHVTFTQLSRWQKKNKKHNYFFFFNLCRHAAFLISSSSNRTLLWTQTLRAEKRPLSVLSHPPTTQIQSQSRNSKHG